MVDSLFEVLVHELVELLTAVLIVEGAVTVKLIISNRFNFGELALVGRGLTTLGLILLDASGHSNLESLSTFFCFQVGVAVGVGDEASVVGRRGDLKVL